MLRRINYWRIRQRAFGFAVFATTGFVFEMLIVEKQLFAGCEYEFRIAVDALEYLVLKLHEEMLPFSPVLSIFPPENGSHPGAPRRARTLDTSPSIVRGT